MRRGKACGTHNLSPTPVYRRNDFSANDIYGFIQLETHATAAGEKLKAGCSPLFFRIRTRPKRRVSYRPKAPFFRPYN